MTYHIKEGKHWAWPRMFGLWRKKKILRMKVRFDFSAEYDLKSNDQTDTNKLFGIGYFWSHHKESARFGWYWNLLTKRVQAQTYCYVEGHRKIDGISTLVLNHDYLMELEIKSKSYWFTIKDYDRQYVVYGRSEIPFTHNKKWSFPLGIYFGGQKKAPHNITIKMSKC